MNWEPQDILDAMETMNPGESVMFNCKGMDGFWQGVQHDWRTKFSGTDFKLEIHYGDSISLVLSKTDHSPAPPVVEEKTLEIEISPAENEPAVEEIVKKPWWGGASDKADEEL